MESRMVFTRRDLLAGGSAFALASALGFSKRAEAAPVTVGAKAPELLGGANDFLNTEGKPVRLFGSDGVLATGSAKAVLIDFWEYTCVNCLRTLPYLKEWDTRYRDKGLVIVGIHTPEFAFAKERENVITAARQFGLAYPLLLDSGYANWNAYGNNFWPRKYLLDPTGKVVYDHAGEGAYGDTETQIQRLLKAANPRVILPRIMLPVRGSDRPGAVCYPQTREIYAGYWRGTDYFDSPGGLRRDADATYSDVAANKRRNGSYTAKGRWRILYESIRHARETQDPWEDYIALPYAALEVNAVIRPERGKPFDLFVLHDGKPVVAEDRGADIRYMADGQSFVRVDQPRMYALLKNRGWGRHELRLGTTSPDFGLYSFTFTSCVVGGTS